MPERPETYPERSLIPSLALRATRRRIVPRVAGAVHRTFAEPTR